MSPERTREALSPRDKALMLYAYVKGRKSEFFERSGATAFPSEVDEFGEVGETWLANLTPIDEAWLAGLSPSREAGGPGEDLADLRAGLAMSQRLCQAAWDEIAALREKVTIPEAADYDALRSPPEQDAGEPGAVRSWRCFHCDEVFTDEAAAALHFGNELVWMGDRVEFDPACRIKQGAEMSLLVALRRLEEEIATLRHQLHTESTEAATHYHNQQQRHYVQMQALEVLGYERGLRDARVHEQSNKYPGEGQ